MLYIPLGTPFKLIVIISSFIVPWPSNSIGNENEYISGEFVASILYTSLISASAVNELVITGIFTLSFIISKVVSTIIKPLSFNILSSISVIPVTLDVPSIIPVNLPQVIPLGKFVAE